MTIAIINTQYGQSGESMISGLYPTGLPWDQIRIAEHTAGGGSNNPYLAYILSSPATGLWINLVRGYTTFNTGTILQNSTINSAKLHIYASTKMDNLGIEPDLNVYAMDNTKLFHHCGDIPFSNPILYSDWAGWLEFVLNPAGIAHINKDPAVDNGNTYFSFREFTHDAEGMVPSWSYNRSSFLRADMSYGGHMAHLEIDYTVEVPPPVTVERMVTVSINPLKGTVAGIFPLATSTPVTVSSGVLQGKLIIEQAGG